MRLQQPIGGCVTVPGAVLLEPGLVGKQDSHTPSPVVVTLTLSPVLHDCSVRTGRSIVDAIEVKHAQTRDRSAYPGTVMCRAPAAAANRSTGAQQFTV